jgi:hypothetical protein
MHLRDTSRGIFVTLQQFVWVADWSRAWTVLARLDARIVGLNPTRGMDVYVYVYVYSMFVLSCVVRERSSDELNTRPRRPTDCPGLRNRSETESFMYAPWSSGSQKGNKKQPVPMRQEWMFLMMAQDVRGRSVCGISEGLNFDLNFSRRWLWRSDLIEVFLGFGKAQLFRFYIVQNLILLANC